VLDLELTAGGRPGREIAEPRHASTVLPYSRGR
jgi:hypothetical protein